MQGPLPWWLEEAPPDPEEPALAGDAEADVAIVGGGYTGLWTALTLKQRDPALRVIVLEAERVGLGPSGRNGGFCHGLWASVRWLRDEFGAEAALRTAAASTGIFDAVRALGEDVWAREGGMMKVATTEAQEAVIDRAVRTAAELGVPEEAVPLSREEVAAAHPLARVPARCLVPGRDHRAAGAPRARAPPRRARGRRHAP